MLGDWGKNLTKTPILVLFIVLISMGVGTASALITITLAGNVHVLGDMVIDETLLIGTDNPNDDDGIRFDDGSEVLFWDESENSFQVTNDLVTEGDLRTTGDLRVGTANAEDNDKIFFDDGTETLMWQNTNSQFELSDGLLVNGDLITTTDVEGETFLVGPSNSGDNDFIFFDFISEHLVWDDAGNRFEFSNDLGIGTDLGTDDDSLYFDSGTNESLTWKNNDNRFELSDDLFVDGDVEIGGKIVGGLNTYVLRNQKDNSPTSSIEVFVDCHPGDIATGGGYNHFGSSTFHIEFNDPTRIENNVHVTQLGGGVQPTGWHVKSLGSVGDDLQAFVVCLNLGP